ncbi:unnamed protein product [Parnassius apollo]|uniref:(apollo) hypothetical protein n=1 Tax=Parnassius apollo TaxID=110799 RepID=A0A8S3X2I5_PARAO|nr:unnamed protein product [Parnassius apollo]
MLIEIILGLFAVAAAYPGIIHDEIPQVEENYEQQGLIGESGHHHQIQHEHAKSHQSIKIEHFHPVPVYIKKEHSHLLKHPLEKGKTEQNLKQIHPETEHSHGGGLVLEDHRQNTDHYGASFGHGGFEQSAEQGGYEHFGGYEGSEGLKAYAELQQPESEGQYYAQHGQSLSGESSEGYHHEGYN